jgi:hypothetical protein
MDKGEGVDINGLGVSWGAVEIGVGGTYLGDVLGVAFFATSTRRDPYRGDGAVIDLLGEVGGRLVNMRLGGDSVSSLGFACNVALLRDDKALFARSNKALMGDGCIFCAST